MKQQTIFEKPAKGFIVEVVCIDPHDGRHRREIFRGQVLASMPEDDENTFRMTTSLPAYFKFPERLIPLSHVVELTYKSDDTRVPARIELGVEDKHLKIQGSKGDIYDVTRQKGQWTCSCLGFHYRGNCRHITEAKLLIKGEKQ